MRKRLHLAGLAISLSVAIGSALVLAQRQEGTGAAPQGAEALLGAAQYLEQVKGDMQGAIAAYRKVLAAPKVTRAQAAHAHFHIGLCYEKLGNGGARKAYEAVARQFADQGEVARLATERLLVLGRPDAPRRAAGPVVSLVYRNERAWVWPVVSPNGRFLAYDDDADLWFRDIETGTVRHLTPPDGELEPCELSSAVLWSPDSSRLIYGCFTEKSRWHLRTVGLQRDTPRIACTSATERIDHIEDWSPDGSSLLLRVITKDYGVDIRTLRLGDCSLRTVQPLGKPGYRAPRAMRFSRDGRYIAYDQGTADDSGDYDVIVVPASGGDAVTVAGGRSVDQVIDWTPDGSALVFLSDRTGSLGLWLVPVAGGRPSGDPRLLKADVGDVATSAARISRTGSLVYSTGRSRRSIHTVRLDVDSGRLLEKPVEVSDFSHYSADSPLWSPDGRFLAMLSLRVSDNIATGARILSIMDARTGAVRHLSLPVYIGVHGMSWTPDGRAIVANARRPDADGTGGNRLVKVVVETGETTELTECKRLACALSPDGDTVFDFMGTAIGARSLRGGQEHVVYAKGADSFPLYPARLSPDGRWLAFVENRPGEKEISTLKVASVDGGDARDLHQAPPGEHIYVVVGWSADSQRVFYRSGDTTWQVRISDGVRARVDLGFAFAGGFTTQPKGDRLAFFAQKDGPSETWLLENFLPAKLVSKSAARE